MVLVSFRIISLLTNGNVTACFFCFFLSIEGENDLGEEDEIVALDEGWISFW